MKDKARLIEQESKKMNINELGARIDIKKAAELIGMAIGRDTPVSNKTVYEWMKRGHFPKTLQVPYGAAVWDTQECLLKLGFK